MLAERNNRDLWRALPQECAMRATFSPMPSTASHRLVVLAGSDQVAIVRLKRVQAALYGALAGAGTLAVTEASEVHAELNGLAFGKRPPEKLTRDAMTRMARQVADALAEAPPAARLFIPEWRGDTLHLRGAVTLAP